MNKVEKVVNQIKPAFGGSISKLSLAMGLNRTTLHHAIKRGEFTARMQTELMRIAKDHDIDLDPADLINA